MTRITSLKYRCKYGKPVKSEFAADELWKPTISWTDNKKYEDEKKD